MSDDLERVRQQILALPPLRDVLADTGLEPRKSLGQHFIFDRNLTDKIAAGARAPGADPAAPLAGRTVVQVGPGPGGLTRSLLRAGADVIAVERDGRAEAALAPLVEAAGGRLTLHLGDALADDWHALVPPGAFIPAVALPFNFVYSKADLEKTIGKPVHTVPQIFVGEEHVGGFDHFSQYVQRFEAAGG